MKRPQPKLFLIIFMIAVLLGCQRDDICPAGTETTPLLQIEFYDAQDPTTLKVAQDLVIIGIGMEDTLLGPTTTNSISIPLRTDQNSTEYRFILNSGTENENEDIVEFTYTPTTDYLNRACGFKVDYLSLRVIREGSSEENWINSDNIIHENIENETEAHIHFTH